MALKLDFMCSAQGSESSYSCHKSKTCLLPNRCSYKYQVISTVQKKPNDSDLLFGAMSTSPRQFSGLSDSLQASLESAEMLKASYFQPSMPHLFSLIFLPEKCSLEFMKGRGCLEGRAESLFRVCFTGYLFLMDLKPRPS